MGKYNIAVLPGDGIGPEVIEQAAKVIEAVGEKYNHSFELKEGLLGGCAIDATGEPFPKETLELCKSSDAVLLGAVGGPKWTIFRETKDLKQAFLGYAEHWIICKLKTCSYLSGSKRCIAFALRYR